MDTTLYVAVSRQVALRREMDVVAHNIANINTTAFRAERTLFDTALDQAGADPVAFVVDRATYTDTRQGMVSVTGRPFDLAVRGPGFLSVETEDGVRYTRDGRLSIDPEGTLVSLSGQPVLDDAGQPMRLPPEERNVTIGADGVVTAGDQVIGVLGLYEFEPVESLEREENGLYRTDGDAYPAFDTTVVQGALEGSNVEPILELTRMMELARAYESVTKLAERSDSLERDAIGRLGRVTT